MSDQQSFESAELKAIRKHSGVAGDVVPQCDRKLARLCVRRSLTPRWCYTTVRFNTVVGWIRHLDRIESIGKHARSETRTGTLEITTSGNSV